MKDTFQKHPCICTELSLIRLPKQMALTKHSLKCDYSSHIAPIYSVKYKEARQCYSYRGSLTAELRFSSSHLSFRIK